MTACTCAPPGGTPRCDRSETCPAHNKGACREAICASDWGMYCRHGLKIIEAVPAEHTRQGPRPLCTLGQGDPFHECAEHKYCPACYPEGRKVEPWPCQEDGCTEADFDRAQEQETEEYWEGINDLMHTQYE